VQGQRLHPAAYLERFTGGSFAGSGAPLDWNRLGTGATSLCEQKQRSN
jgi:hypothetical protein